MSLMTRDEEIRAVAAQCAAQCNEEEMDDVDLIELAQSFEGYIRTGNLPKVEP